MSISSIDEQPCSYHPNVRTRLRCSKCEKPICPRCYVATPVGYRCPDCAGVRGLPTYETSPAIMIKAIGAGVLIAGAIGILWGYYSNWQFYLALLLGFGVAEGMSWVSNYKRGRDLQIAAVACVAFGLVVSRVVIAMTNPFGLGMMDLLNNAMHPLISNTFQIRLIPDIAFAVLAGLIPFVRFR
jgi:hypothetical protein